MLSNPLSVASKRVVRPIVPPRRKPTPRPKREAAPRVVPAGRKGQGSEDTRRRLLDAAEVEFGRSGFAGARLDKIAGVAKVKTPLIHFYFDGKIGLYRAVVERAVQVLRRDVGGLLEAISQGLYGEVPLEPEREMIETLCASAVALTIRFFREQGAVLAILRQAATEGHTSTRTLVRKQIRPVFEAMVGALAALPARGKVSKALDPHHLFASIFSMAAFPTSDPLFVDLIWDERASSRSESAEATAAAEAAFDAARTRQIVELVMRGMQPR